MGVYIKGMEMPTEGYIDVRIKCNGTASFAIADNPYFKAVEAVPVPPHGRLIEDTAVQEQIDEWLDSVGDVVVGHGLSYYGELLGCIEDAPTIIPASEEGE